VFDHPSPAAVAAHLEQRLLPAGTGADPASDPGGADRADGEIRRLLAALAPADLRRAGLLDPLLRLADRTPAQGTADPAREARDTQDTQETQEIQEMAVDDLVRMALGGERD
jgi:hypothetical protein